MTNTEAIKILSAHLMQCGMLMPIEWVQQNGEGSKLMDAFQLAISALRDTPKTRRRDTTTTITENTKNAILRIGEQSHT